jgi:hypothetical protein
MADAPLLNPTFLFRFEISLRKHKLNWSIDGLKLPEDCQIPCFGVMGQEPTDRMPYADVRMAWDSGGIGFWMKATGKKQLPWCRDSRIEESDGLQLWIDTRNSQGIQRANRFCQQYNFAPFGGGPKRDQPFAAWVMIQRAKQQPHDGPPSGVKVFARATSDGYEMSGLIPATALTGFDPAEYSRINLFYQVVDREMGQQTLSLEAHYHTFENPAMWVAANLVT